MFNHFNLFQANFTLLRLPEKKKKKTRGAVSMVPEKDFLIFLGYRKGISLKVSFAIQLIFMKPKRISLLHTLTSSLFIALYSPFLHYLPFL